MQPLRPRTATRPAVPPAVFRTIPPRIIFEYQLRLCKYLDEITDLIQSYIKAVAENSDLPPINVQREKPSLGIANFPNCPQEIQELCNAITSCLIKTEENYRALNPNTYMLIKDQHNGYREYVNRLTYPLLDMQRDNPQPGDIVVPRRGTVTITDSVDGVLTISNCSVILLTDGRHVYVPHGVNCILHDTSWVGR